MKHLFLILTFFSSAAIAGTEAAQLVGDPVSLKGHIEVLRDADPAWTLDDVRKPGTAQFAPSDSSNFNFGYSDKPSWFRLALQNPVDSQQQRWVFSFGLPVVDYFDVHLVRANGRVETTLTGDLRHRPDNQLNSNEFSLPLDIASGEAVMLYVRVENDAARLVVFTLSSEPGYWSRALGRNLSSGALIGAYLALALYNLLVFAWARERTYLLLALALLSSVGLNAVFGGYVRAFGNEWSEHAPQWISLSLAFLVNTTPLMLLLSGREFLQTRLHLPRLDRLLWALCLASSAVVLFVPAFSYKWATILGNAQLALYSPLLMGVAYVLWQRGQRIAGFFMLSNLFITAAYLSSVLIIAGRLSANGLLLLTIPLMGALGAILFSLAIADRVLGERRERERITRLKNFFAPQVAEAILDEGGASLLAPKRREVTVLFADLRGFTTLAAQSEPEELIRVLREYHEAVVDTTAKHGGNIEHFAGDGVMIYFNAPVEVSEPEARAVRMAFELRQQFEQLCTQWRKRGHDLGVGIGMACGFATVGAVGAKGRMDYSCIGTVTNLAARLCAIAKHGQILTPQQFINRVEALATTEPMGEKELKGMPKPVAVFNLINPTEIPA